MQMQKINSLLRSPLLKRPSNFPASSAVTLNCSCTLVDLQKKQFSATLVFMPTLVLLLSPGPFSLAGDRQIDHC